MKKNFHDRDWRSRLPLPVCEEHPEYEEFYKKAWELAHEHIRDVLGMPQTPYMDEAFCDTQIWIWDTCFMSMFCKFAQDVFPGVESLRNFYEPLHNGRALPEIVPTENEPSWINAPAGVPYPIQIHIADNPPLFAWSEYENALIHGDREYLKTLLYHDKFLQKHYDWFENLTEIQSIHGVFAESRLCRERDGYRWEGGRSGMDNTPRGRKGTQCRRARPNNPDLLWIDAICQQALSAKMLAKAFALIGDTENERLWQKAFADKQATVNRLYWDEEDQFYYDVDRSDLRFCKVMTIASYWALTAGIANKEQAAAMATRLKKEENFGGTVPLVSLARNDGDFSPTGKYWRGSLWLPTAYATLKGLAEYEMYEDAHDAASAIFDYMLKTYREYEPHTIWECYAPEGYRPGTQTDGKTDCRPDFCGWSALGPISLYIEYVLGFHTINAFENVVKWAKPRRFKGRIGIRNLRFGDIVTDIVSDENTCVITSNAPYTLEINQKPFSVGIGETVIKW